MMEKSLKVSSSFGDLQVNTYGELKHDLVLFHHGAGYTSFTWKSLISVLNRSLKDVCFVSFDMRSHGNSCASSEFSIKDLVSDAMTVLTSVTSLNTSEINVFLAGHSLGAAVLAQLPDIFNGGPNSNVKFTALIMIDIIEETAINSLSRMPEIIKDIPKSFDSLEDAVKWSLSSSHSHHNMHVVSKSKHFSSIEESIKSQLKYNTETHKYEWRADLSAMQAYWTEWFEGLTKNFLKFPRSRLLVLADTEYMDREMIIAQMQGKFQLAIIKESGHAIQEDRPEELAEHFINLIQKHIKLSEILRIK